MPSPVIRPARPSDVADILRLVRELATYERAPGEVRAVEADFTVALFGPDPQVYCHVVEQDDRLVGFAVWYVTFSTWLGRHGIWLEDLFVTPAARGRGLGRDLLSALAGICIERGYHRLEWWVLDWNEPAQQFYRSVGARAQDGWTVWRLDLAGVQRLASVRQANGPSG